MSHPVASTIWVTNAFIFASFGFILAIIEFVYLGKINPYFDDITGSSYVVMAYVFNGLNILCSVMLYAAISIPFVHNTGLSIGLPVSISTIQCGVFTLGIIVVIEESSSMCSLYTNTVETSSYYPASVDLSLLRIKRMFLIDNDSQVSSYAENLVSNNCGIYFAPDLVITILYFIEMMFLPILPICMIDD